MKFPNSKSQPRQLFNDAVELVCSKACVHVKKKAHTQTHTNQGFF